MLKVREADASFTNGVVGSESAEHCFLQFCEIGGLERSGDGGVPDFRYFDEVGAGEVIWSVPDMSVSTEK